MLYYRGGEWKPHRYRYKLHIDTSCIHQSRCATGVNGRELVVTGLRSSVYFYSYLSPSSFFMLPVLHHSPIYRVVG